MFERKLQVSLDQAQYERVVVARKRRMSIGAVIREAIDRGPPPSNARRSAVARSILDEPRHLDPASPDLDELVS